MAKNFGEAISNAASHRFAMRALEALSPVLAGALRLLLEQIQILTDTIAEHDRQTEELAFKYQHEVAPLQQIGRVGTLTAVTDVLTLDTPRFAHSRDVGAFLGLNSEPQPVGRMRPAASGKVQCAHQMLSRDGAPSALRDWRLAKAAGPRRNKKLTISAMAHKLAVLMHRLWSRGEAYVPYPVLLQVA
jgi:transposase